MNRIVYVFYLSLIGCLLLLGGCRDKGTTKGKAEREKTSTPIVETGELAAVRSKAFVMPRFDRWSQMRIIGLAEHGQVLKEGDSIIQLDPEEVTKYITSRENTLESQEATLKKMLVNQKNRDSQAESTIQSEEATYELRKLQLASSRFESERARRISELQFQQATIALNKSRKTMELNNVIAANDLKIQEIKVKQIKKDIKEAYEVLPQLTIRTPQPGIFQLVRNRRSGELLKMGDEVSRGNTMASVPDLTWMKVITHINENDFLKIAEGQKVLVRLDALPEISFKGEIAYIGKLCFPLSWDKPRQKVFDVTVNLLESDERLKPGMTVSCEFIEAN